MKIALSCPHAEYRDGMRVFCTRGGTYCGNQYFKACKGWWALTANAARCPLRKGGIGDGGDDATAPNDRD